MDSQLSIVVSDVIIRFLDDFLQLYSQPCPKCLQTPPRLVFTLDQPYFWPHMYLLSKFLRVDGYFPIKRQVYYQQFPWDFDRCYPEAYLKAATNHTDLKKNAPFIFLHIRHRFEKEFDSQNRSRQDQRANIVRSDEH